MINIIAARTFLRTADIFGLLLLPFFLTLMMTPGLVLAGTAGAESRAEALTHSLVAHNIRYTHANPAAKSKLLDQLIETATARQQVLGELLQDKPASVIKYALPERILEKMPDTVRKHLENRIVAEGELEALYEDYKDGSHKLLYFLRASGKRYSLHFDTRPEQIRPGKPARVSGLLLESSSTQDTSSTDGTLLVSSDGDNILYLDPNGGTSTTQGGGLGEPVKPLGEQRTLVLLVNFQDSAGETPYTLAQAHDAVFGTVGDYFREASYGKTWLTGEVRGWYTLPIDSSCDGSTIANAADAAATADGVNLSNYDRFIYIRVGSAPCFYNGASTMFRYPSQAYIDGGISPRVIGHELGHGLGMGHSRILDCGDTVLGADCTKPIDDEFDLMSYTNELAHFSAFQKERLGWFSPGEVLTINADGVYVLQPFELAETTSPKVLKILQQQDPTGQGATWYYLEYRQALGFDSFITGNSNVLNGVLLRTGADFDYSSSLLLDMTPNSSIFAFEDVSDPALVVGKSFTDNAAGITIATNQADTAGSSVSISLGQPDCVHNNPLVALSPPESPWVASGTTVTYSVTVTNTDSAACSMTDFDLSAVAPTGWSVALDGSALQIAPGASSSVNMIVTSPPTESEGFYDITVTASENHDATISGSAIATYVIEPADPTPTCSIQTPTLSVTPGSQNGNPGTTLFYTVSLSNTDSAACDASDFDLSITSLPAGWSSDLFPATISLSPGTTGSTTFSVTSAAGAAAGNYNLQVVVSDTLEPGHTKTGAATYVVNDTSPGDDTEAPSTPTGLVAAATRKQVSLSWNGSSDNTGVAGYQVWREGVVIADTADTVFTDQNLADNVQYQYSVDAYDAAYNVSAMSDPVTAGKAKSKAKGSGGGKGKGPNK